MNVERLKIKKYELVPPDGGWGYLVSLGFMINMVCTTTFHNCFGVIFKELFVQLKIDSTNIMLFNAVNALCASISGFFTASLLKYMSVRKLGISAALLHNLGTFTTVFVKSKVHFFITQGIMQNIAYGIIFNLSLSQLTSYFVEKRLIAVSLTQTVVAICAFVTPQFIKWSLESYGFRGTLLLISAVSLHCIFAMTLMQPVSWHMKRVDVPEDKENETQSLLTREKQIVNNKDDLTASLKSASLKSQSLEYATDICDGNYKTDAININNRNSEATNFTSHFVDVSLLKTLLFSNTSVGVALCIFSEMTFTLMIPQALYFMGWNETEVAWALTLNALGDLVTRSLFIFMSSVLAKFGSHEIYVAGLVVAFMSRLGMLWSDNRSLMVTCMTIMGISRCTIMLLVPIVIADAIGPEKFVSAIGLLMLLTGVFSLIVGPIIGAVRDLTDSYSTAFYILTSFFAIVVMFWSIELFYKKNKYKRIPKIDIASKP